MRIPGCKHEMRWQTNVYIGAIHCSIFGSHSAFAGFAESQNMPGRIVSRSSDRVGTLTTGSCNIRETAERLVPVV